MEGKTQSILSIFQAVASMKNQPIVGFLQALNAVLSSMKLFKDAKAEEVKLSHPQFDLHQP